MIEPGIDVVGIGAASWDRSLVVPRFPEPDDKVRAIHEEESAGGMTATALVALRRWGLRCRFIGMLGFDEISDRIIADLEHEQLLTDALVRREDADGRRALIIVDNRNGHRSIVSGPHRIPPILPTDLAPSMFQGARILSLDTSVDECAVEAAEMAHAAGLKVTLDAERIGARTAKLLRRCDHVIAAIDFARRYTGQQRCDRAAYALHLEAKVPIIVTDGARGCDYVSEDLSFHQPAFDVPVVDGTGAGDVFHAAFDYGLLATWEPRRVVRFAAWAAAQVCREVGGRKGIPSHEEVRHFVHENH